MNHTHDLAGISVVSLAVNLPGPLAAHRLQRLGARVVKVEPPSGDPLAAVARSWYDELAAGQQVVTLDLKSPAGRGEFDALLAEVDVLITAMRPSAADRLGVAEFRSRHRRLSQVEIVGYDGGRADESGHDLTYQAAHGTLTPGIAPMVPVIDLLGAERVVWEALLALRERDRTGSGGLRRVVLDAAAADAGAAIRHGLLGPGAPLGGADPAYGSYATADGHIAVAAIEPHFRKRLYDELGADDHDGLAAAFASRSTAGWVEFGDRVDVPIARVHTYPSR